MIEYFEINFGRLKWANVESRVSTNVEGTQTSAKASNLNRMWSGIRLRIAGLIGIRIRMSAGSLPKYCEFVTLSASVI